jgi:hypothetical protein
MNILLNINDFNIENVFILESKENMIINGVFNKILYSTSFFTMNGIYLFFPVIDYNIKYNNGKNILNFNIIKNMDLISNFSKLEKDLLNFYIKSKKINNKKIINTFEKQLNNGNIKFYKYFCSKKEFYLKISGIWETYNDIGITYKLIYY